MSATPPAPAATTTADSSRSPRRWAWTTPRSRIPSSGFSLVTLNPEAKRRYRPTIERLQRALKAHTAATATDTKRSFRGPAARHGSSGGGVRVKAVCDCGRNVRVVPSVLAQAPIVCGGCGKPFRIPEVVGAGELSGAPHGAGLTRRRPSAGRPRPRSGMPALPQACGTMASCTRQPHRTPLSSG